MKNPQRRENILRSRARRAGCTIEVISTGSKHVTVMMPGFPDYGVGIDMTAEIDAYLATGAPSATEIIGHAVGLAEADNYYPAWNYVLDAYSPQQVDRRNHKALYRKLAARGRLVWRR